MCASSFGGLIILNVEVSEFVVVLAGGDNSQVLLQVLLLEVLLGQVLQVSLAEGDAGLNDDIVGVLGHGHGGAEVAGLAVNLDVLLEVVFEVAQNDDVVLDGELAVDGELVADLLSLLGALLLHNLLAHVLYLIFYI